MPDHREPERFGGIGYGLVLALVAGLLVAGWCAIIMWLIYLSIQVHGA